MGNTHSKVGIFDGGKIKTVVTFDDGHPGLASWLGSTHFDKAIVCSVSAPQKADELPQAGRKIIVLDHNTPLPISVSYSTPHTLGLDRIAAATGAWQLFGGNCLVVDAGTAITYDFISADGIFMGGNIAPGVSMRYKSLAEHTARLPLLAPDDGTALPDIGDTTENAIRCGVEMGVTAETEHWYSMAQKMMTKPIIAVTGGEGNVLCRRCPDSMPITYEPNLVHYGLYCILDNI